MAARDIHLGEDPLWYKDAVIYEVHVKSFYDSTGNGIGDFRGLLRKLPYLEELGVTAVWLLPFYPSPLRDDGYDIADYLNINPDYGTLGDFREFLRAAHARGIRVITELVLNHTSDQHAWFQRSRRAKPGSAWRDFYVWSESPDRYRDARIIFKDFEASNWSWDPVAKAYYWHRFYAHQPDLNFDNPRVHKALLRVLDFWFGMGVDGLRLDAIPYLYEREGTNCENLPETYAFLEKLRAHMDAAHSNRLLLAEANQWPEDAVAYFGKGDMCHMAFHFPLMPRMFMALQMEDRFPVIDILEQTPAIPDNCQWGLFLRNHDELTLEMVTDEERDYMYRVYARDPRARINLGIRRRLAPLMGNDRRKMELMNVLLFALPGTPIIYYGDEIGMGDNYYLGDRNGVRTPMQWGPDRNAGFSMSNPQSLFLPVIIDSEYHYEAVNVETQARNPSSLLWWMRRMISLRRQYRAFGRGSVEFFLHDNPKVLAFIRRYEDEIILVLVNLSRHTQSVEINTPRFAGFVPEDLFSRNSFPPVKDAPYVIIMGGHDYQLLLMKGEAEAIVQREEEARIPELQVKGGWESVLDGKVRERMERSVLPEFLNRSRWFGGKGRAISSISITERIPVSIGEETVLLLFIDVAYAEGGTEVTLLPIHFADRDEARRLTEEHPQSVIARLAAGGREGVLYDGAYSEALHMALYETFSRGRRTRLKGGDLAGRRSRAFRTLQTGRPESSTVLKAEQSNTSILYDNNLILKLYRRLEEGVNPEVEMGMFLTDLSRFEGAAPMAGTVEYRRPAAEPWTIAMVQGYIPNHGDGWSFTLDEVERYYDLVLSKMAEVPGAAPLPTSLFDVDFAAVPPLMQELIGGFYLEMAALLGKRTGELHLSLASRPDDPAFSPEPYSILYQRSVYQSIRSLTRKVVTRLGRKAGSLASDVRQEAEWVLAAEQDILRRLQLFLDRKFSAMKTRIHGDYHLGQVLFTGKDFIIIDFEGEPARTISERRLKRSPLRDVAGMIRSFHYAAHVVLLRQLRVRSEDLPLLEEWAEAWYRHVSGIFLHAYLATVAGSPFIPVERRDLEVMLDAFMLEKAIYELGYELDHRPDWIAIPIRGIRNVLCGVSTGDCQSSIDLK